MIVEILILPGLSSLLSGGVALAEIDHVVLFLEKARVLEMKVILFG
jgi:hypothetical protein